MGENLAEYLRNQTRLQKLGDLVLFWVAVLLWPLVLVALGTGRLIKKGFAWRRLGYVASGLLVLVLDAIGIILGMSNGWWLIALGPHASVPIAVIFFFLEIARINLIFRLSVWYWNRRMNWRQTRRE